MFEFDLSLNPITAPALSASEIEERFATVDGLRMRYLRVGEGPPLLLIHGLIGYSFSWRFNWTALAPHATLFAVDLLGTGYSDRSPTLDCRLPAAAGRLLRFLDDQKIESADVLGTSHGGGLAMTLAAMAEGRVRRLILVAPVNPWSRHGRLLAPLLARIPGGGRLQPLVTRLGPLHRFLLRRQYGDPRRISPGTLEGYRAAFQIPGTLDYARRILDGWRADLRELERILPRIAHIPTLLVWGSRDGVVSPASARPLLQNFARAELAMLEGAGHVPYEEVPEEFNRAVIGFLAKQHG
ncbi:MAG TPA: alpha/beta fold hydrolase [Terriglobales bacterium]|nr:alpha/beta fold hydrolase [Terriglobales bacterium]